MENESKKTSVKEDIFDWIESMAVSVFVIILLFTFVFRVVQVSGTSMLNTLQNEDKIITSNLFYTPERSDIIVCNSVGLDEIIVKRIIALAGDTVDIDFEAQTVYVNGKKIDEEYISSQTTQRDVSFPVTVPEGTVFVMGDNRKVSLDSRSSDVGFIATDQILGKVIVRVFPFDTFGFVE